MRIHPFSQRTNRPTNQASNVDFVFDGHIVAASEGECVAVALFAAGIKTLRRSPRQHAPRGMFCLMGSCQECLVMIGGRRVLACRTPVAAGLIVEQVDVEEEIATVASMSDGASNT